MRFRERQQEMIFAAAVVIIGGFVLFRYLPLHRRMNAVEQVRVAQTLAINKGTGDGGQLPVLKDQLRGLRAKVADYQANIPEQRTLGVFLGRIADLMNEHNLTEQVIAPGPEAEADRFHCIPVTMECKGQLKQIFEFYRRLQDLDRLVRIEKVRLRNDSEFKGQVSMETQAVIYYRPGIGQG